MLPLPKLASGVILFLYVECYYEKNMSSYFIFYKAILWAWSHLLPECCRQERYPELQLSDEETEAQKVYQLQVAGHLGL